MICYASRSAHNCCNDAERIVLRIKFPPISSEAPEENVETTASTYKAVPESSYRGKRRSTFVPSGKLIPKLVKNSKVC